MALGPREFVEEVEKYFDLIEQKRKVKKAELNIPANQRLKLSEIDISEFEDDVYEITVALHRLFIMQTSINNLSNADTEKLLKKAKLITLAGLVYAFKNYDNKAWGHFWQFYGSEAGLSVNESFIDKVLRPVLSEEGLIRKKLDRNDSYEELIAEESYLPQSIIEDIFDVLNIYKKYFYPTLLIRDFFKELNEKHYHNLLSLIPDEIEREKANNLYKRLAEIKNRVTETLIHLMQFNSFINTKDIPLDKDTISDFSNEFKNLFQTDLSEIFSNDSLKEKFVSIFPSIYPFQLLRYISKYNDTDSVVMPDGTAKTVLDLKASPLDYGVYKINQKEFIVTPNQSHDLEYFLNLEKEKIIVQVNKAMIISDLEIESSLGPVKTLNQPNKIYQFNELKGYIWYGNKPLLEPLNIINIEGDEIDSYQPEENLISSLSLKLKDKDKSPHFSLDLDYLLIVSKENKGKKVRIVDTERNNNSKEFIIDNVGFSGKIPYKIKSKSPGLITLYLTSQGEPLELKQFESRLNVEIEDFILFDSYTNLKINPSKESYFGVSKKLFLFSTKEFDPKWINDVCEVSVYQNFGRYNVYEIDWLDTTKALDLDISKEFKWKFENVCVFDVNSKHNSYPNSKYISYGKNYFHSLKDIHISLSPSTEKVVIGNIDIKVTFNYDVVAPNMKTGAINLLLGRDFNNNEIDENFIKSLLPSFTSLSYGRYDFEFCYEESVLGKHSVFVIPEFELTEGQDVYNEGDEVVLTLSSKKPCFRNGKTSQSYLFDDLAKCNFSINQNKMIEVKRSMYHKIAKLYNPYVEIPLKYDPEIIGYRFMQDNRLYNTDKLDYYDIDKNSLIVKVSHRDARFRINNSTVKPLIPNNSGIIIEPLVSSKDYISKTVNEVSVQIGKNELDFEIVWNTKVSKLSSQNLIYSSEDGISFLMSYEGSNQSILKFIMTDPQGKSLDIRKISVDGDSSAKFVRYDRQKNCIFITCDGRKWEDRQFTFYLDPIVTNEVENISLEGIYEESKETFGKLIYINELTNPELSEINSRINQDKENPYTYFERGFLYSEMNMISLAENDFNQSVSLGLDDEEAKEYIEMFKESKVNNLLNYELSQLTNLARRLYTDELLLEVE